jgi:hypothetical protein
VAAVKIRIVGHDLTTPTLSGSLPFRLGQFLDNLLALSPPNLWAYVPKRFSPQSVRGNILLGQVESNPEDMIQGGNTPLLCSSQGGLGDPALLASQRPPVEVEPSQRIRHIGRVAHPERRKKVYLWWALF